MIINQNDEQKYKLLGSLKYFTEVFYKLRTNRLFKVSDPHSRISHHLIIMRALTKVLRGETKRLLINVPPRYSKTELVINFVSWALAQYPDSNFIYVSYSHTLAKKQTQTIREIVSMSQYRKTFGVELKSDTQAKDNFETTAGGRILAVGSGGSITGSGAGIQGVDRFGGCIILDDLLKPDEATSDVVREGINEWYFNTLQSRTNSPDTPIILIAQRLHENDICQMLIEKGGWETIIIPALDEAGNALNPEMHTKDMLLKMKEESPYNFSSQYQQTPIPSGGGLFKPEWFPILDEMPKILATFVTCDTASSAEAYNDATVFSFWGIYELDWIRNVSDEKYALVWLDCHETRVEPKDLESEFMEFWYDCMRFSVKPSLAGIEKASTGIYLISLLEKIQGLRVIDLVPTKFEGKKLNNKSNRFIQIQPYIAQKRIAFVEGMRHADNCIKHMSKITSNNSHRFDDICDTAAYAIKMAFIDKVITFNAVKADYSEAARLTKQRNDALDNLRKKTSRRY